MVTLVHARSVANFAGSLSDFQAGARSGARYSSMGAVLIDAVLQAGLNYKTVVYPRVEHFLSHFPLVRTTTQFNECLQANGPEKVLLWKHSEKVERLLELTRFFVEEGVETIQQLYRWINLDGNRGSLLNLRGIGNKTVDYIAMLVGIPSIPVDRHIRTFVSAAGVELVHYDEFRKVAELAADLMKVPRSDFDYAVWSYVSSGKLRQPSLALSW